MQVQVNTDASIQGHKALAERVEAQVESALNRFREQIARVEVTITDENAMKHGSTDKRCLMEARAMGLQPVAVSYQAATIGDAVIGAARRLRAALGRSLGNRIDYKGGFNPQDVSG
jgi:hypothetical protein